MRPRPLWLSGVLTVSTIVAGLVVRMVPLGMPQFVTKYGGSMLWAMMIYWLVTTLLPAIGVHAAALAACVAAAAVEFFKLYRSPGVDAFRATLAGTLLLGRHFSIKDVLAYCLAIGLGALLDWSIRAEVRLKNAKGSRSGST